MEKFDKISIYFDTNMLERRHSNSALFLSELSINPEYYEIENMIRDLSLSEKVEICIPEIVWIDDGYYREKSASVHVRLMYFYTLLYMSLRYKRIKFPHFLLIDTPDTNGIDPESLKRAIRQIQNIEVENEDYQVILTTMEYPEEFEEYTKGDILIKKENYLLKRHEKANK